MRLLFSTAVIAIVKVTSASADDIIFEQHGSIQYVDNFLPNDVMEQLKNDISLTGGHSHRGQIMVSKYIQQRILDAVGRSECSIDADTTTNSGGMFQTRFIGQSTQPHVDRYHHNNEVVDDDVMFVALDSNPDAHFTHGDSSIPAVAGRLFRFAGSIKHGTTFNGGNPIQLLGPFSTKNFASVGTPIKVFATSQTYSGDLGGVSGADAKCQEHACSAGLIGNFKAWISDASSNPANDFNRQGGCCLDQAEFLLTGSPATRIAINFPALIAGNPLNPINKDENGVAITSGILNVWTNTNGDGTRRSSTDCQGWTSSSSALAGTTGNASRNDTTWTFFSNLNCAVSARLYCFQQDDTDVCPTLNPTSSPTSAPSKAPSSSPTSNPTSNPTSAPSKSPSNAPTLSLAPTLPSLSKSGKSTKASKDMSAKSVKSIKASEDESLDVEELLALILGVILLLLQDSHDGIKLGAMLEALKPEGHDRVLLEDKEDIKALLISLLKEKLNE